MLSRTALLLTVTYVLLFPCSLVAQFGADVISHDSHNVFTQEGSRCTGVLQVEALGDSGPFDVQIILNDPTSERPVLTGELTLESSQGQIVENICSGEYTIIYTNRFGCEFQREATVTECERENCCEDFILYDAPLTEYKCSGECDGVLGVSTSRGRNRRINRKERQL